jgi:anthranilate synthase component 2/para-aminobenzoate synthetase component 2
MHGKTSLIYHDGKTIYEGLASPFEAGRYHSLSIEQGTLPPYLKVTAVSEGGEVMGVRHERFVVEGVQFHPESILTEVGHHILKRFLSISHPLWGATG